MLLKCDYLKIVAGTRHVIHRDQLDHPLQRGIYHRVEVVQVVGIHHHRHHHLPEKDIHHHGCPIQEGIVTMIATTTDIPEEDTAVGITVTTTDFDDLMTTVTMTGKFYPRNHNLNPNKFLKATTTKMLPDVGTVAHVLGRHHHLHAPTAIAIVYPTTLAHPVAIADPYHQDLMDPFTTTIQNHHHHHCPADLSICAVKTQKVSDRWDHVLELERNSFGDTCPLLHWCIVKGSV